MGDAGVAEILQDVLGSEQRPPCFRVCLDVEVHEDGVVTLLDVGPDVLASDHKVYSLQRTDRVLNSIGHVGFGTEVQERLSRRHPLEEVTLSSNRAPNLSVSLFNISSEDIGGGTFGHCFSVDEE